MKASSEDKLAQGIINGFEPAAKVVSFAGQDDLVLALASRLEQAAHKAIAERGLFLIALSGGHTPEDLYRLLATPEWIDRFDWSRVHIFFGDERAVPPDDPRSNFRSARLALLDWIPVRGQQVHRWLSEVDDLEIAAREYASQLAALGGRLDVTLLGLGPDGHIASLFPHSSQVSEQEKGAVATAVSPTEPYVRRLTLTFPSLNASREVWFLAVGEGKSEPVRASFQEPVDALARPSQGIKLQENSPVWFLDDAAAKLLT